MTCADVERDREWGDLPLVFFQQLGFRSIGFTCHIWLFFCALHPHSFTLHLPLFHFGLECYLRSAPPIWIVLIVCHTSQVDTCTTHLVFALRRFCSVHPRFQSLHLSVWVLDLFGLTQRTPFFSACTPHHFISYTSVSLYAPHLFTSRTSHMW